MFVSVVDVVVIVIVMAIEQNAGRMATDQNSHIRQVVISILVVCTAIGIFGGGQEADSGIVVAWFWMGIGLAVTYLLYRVVVVLQRFEASR
ncbi:hypothetical protein C484_15989 [Natrialba taiwanensis DSM 12281]|uniref:Uncharacterized protein n=2 Tax=Natrialba taiwanensis TaxID=160846 RepID=L9ZNJ1_9EURY|nr:hypothetical protein C484_15989 [Natrialba taiwanensis DSM 12281]